MKYSLKILRRTVNGMKAYLVATKSIWTPLVKFTEGVVVHVIAIVIAYAIFNGMNAATHQNTLHAFADGCCLI